MLHTGFAMDIEARSWTGPCAPDRRHQARARRSDASGKLREIYHPSSAEMAAPRRALECIPEAFRHPARPPTPRPIVDVDVRVLDILDDAVTAEILRFGVDHFNGEDAIALAAADPTFIEIGAGRHRHVFRCGDHVVKIPRGEWGLASNDREATVARDAAANGGWLFGIRYAFAYAHGSILVMDYAEPLQRGGSSLPEWTWSVDCSQVGIDRKGHLVAYDFGYRMMPHEHQA